MSRRLSLAARRAEIVQVADELIAAEGYRSLSLREVARRCGMSAPGLMHHFPDMESLLNAVLTYRDEVDLAAIAASQPEDAPIEEIIEAALLYYERRRDAARRFDLLEAEAVDPTHPAHSYYLNRDARSWASVRSILEREFDDAELASRLLGIVFDGLRFRLLRDPDHVDFRREWHAIRDTVLQSLKRREDVQSSLHR